MSDPISQLGLTCPSGGDFYVCQGNSTQFLGCCTSDPCQDGKGSCPQSDLRTSSFNESAYSDVKPQACESSSAGKWYTCSQLDTPFLGCCSTNACDDGCPTKDLLAARLSDNKQSATVFMTTTSTTTKTASTSSATEASSTSSTTATATAETHSTSSPGLSKGAKVGIALGSAIAVIALLAALFILGNRYLRKRRGVVVTGSPPSVMMSNPVNSYIYHDPNRILHTPPPFSSPSLEPLAAGHSDRTTAESDAYPPNGSANSSPSLGGIVSAVNRQSSVTSPVGEELDPTSSQQQQQKQPPQPVAELDGGKDLETPRSLPETPYSPACSAHLQSHPPSMYRPYRPSMQDFQDPKSGLYP